MTTVRRLREPDREVRERLPICEATVSYEAQFGATTYYRERRERWAEKNGVSPSRCKHRASWLVNGRHLCTRHAGAEALEILSKKTPCEGTWKGVPFSQLTTEQREEMKRSLWK